MPRIRTALCSMAAGSLLVAAGAAQAEFPEKDITVIIGYNAGGGTDIHARAMAPYLEKHLGGKASVVVKNVPGAGGQIGLEKVFRMKADGYTLGHFNVPPTLGRLYDRKCAYDLDSFDYIAAIAHDANVLAAPKNSQYKNIDELFKEGRKESGLLTYALAGYGGDDHFAALAVEKAGGIKLNLVPFNGGGPSRLAVMGGHVAIAGLNVSEAKNFTENLKFFGIMDYERSDLMPDVPTFKEQGYDIFMAVTLGYVAPKGIPADVKEKYYAAFKAMFADKEFHKSMAKQGIVPKLLVGDAWEKLVRDTNVIIKEAWDTNPWKK